MNNTRRSNMKRWTVFSLVVVFILGMTGCGGGGAKSGPESARGPDLAPEAAKEVVKKEPDWYKKPPSETGYQYAKGEATSASKQGARRKAINSLINDFQLKTKSITEGRSEDFFEELSQGDASDAISKYEQIQTVIWNGVVQNWEEVASETVVEQSTKDGKRSYIYRTYVLGRINLFAADERLLEQIKRDKELMTQLKATKALDKMREDLDKYKDKFGM
jgi:hypothetical protein